MKKTLYLIGISLLILTGCSSSDETTKWSENNEANLKSTFTNSWEYSIGTDNKLLTVIAEKSGTFNKNSFILKDVKSGSVIFNLDYSFDTSKNGWKYAEQSKGIVFAKKLQAKNLSKMDLEDLNYMLNSAYSEFFDDVKTKGLDFELFSTLAYLKAATDSNIRAIKNNTNQIDGAINPGFLVGKSMFSFQEDIIFDVNILKQNINYYRNEKNYVPGDAKLVNYIETTNQSTVSYDVLYDFYIPKQQFIVLIDELAQQPLHKEDCSKACTMGCGSDLGCCGNYTGCCYYSAKWCYTHDVQCSDCRPAFYCGPFCQEDFEPNTEVRYYGFVKNY